MPNMYNQNYQDEYGMTTPQFNSMGKFGVLPVQ
jgi:hypothetical protein